MLSGNKVTAATICPKSLAATAMCWFPFAEHEGDDLEWLDHRPRLVMNHQNASFIDNCYEIRMWDDVGAARPPGRL